jgi:glycerophosphoryl diester phosphodiesterase
LRVAGYGLPCGPIGGHCAQVPLAWEVAGRNLPLVDSGFINAAHGRGIPVHVWTIDDPATMEHLLDLGVDGLMTDRPALLKQMLEDRAQWVTDDY